MSKYRLIKKAGYNDGYYWNTRYCFELDGKRYIFTDIGSSSGYVPRIRDIMEVKNDENLDMLLKDWDIWDITPKDLSKEDAIQYVKQLKYSETKIGKAFELWSDDEDE
jgi:hydroxymethylpyrimidine pyrophosphatase-like HAD family hydrolase